MAECMLQTCDNEVKGRRYCCNDCKSSAKQRRENPDAASLDYRPVEPDLKLLDEGAWLMFTLDHEEQKCIGDFIRMFKRPPAHVLTTKSGRFAGPVTTNEELTRRWSLGDKNA